MAAIILKFTLAVVLGIFIFAVIWFRGGVTQEPFETAISALRLEFSAEKKIDLNENEFVVRSRYISAVLDSFRDEGWQHVEQLGSAIFLERDDKKADFLCRMYSSRYMVCEKFEI